MRLVLRLHAAGSLRVGQKTARAGCNTEEVREMTSECCKAPVEGCLKDDSIILLCQKCGFECQAETDLRWTPVEIRRDGE